MARSGVHRDGAQISKQIHRTENAQAHKELSFGQRTCLMQRKNNDFSQQCNHALRLEDSL